MRQEAIVPQKTFADLKPKCYESTDESTVIEELQQ